MLMKLLKMSSKSMFYAGTLFIAAAITVSILFLGISEANALTQVFNDSFTGHADGTDPDGWTEVSGAWACRNDSGNIVYEHGNNTTSGAHTKVTAIDKRDSIFKMRFKIDSWASNGAVWLAVRYTDTNNMVQVGYDRSAGQWQIREKINGNLSVKAFSSATLSTGVWYKVKANALKEQIVLSVDSGSGYQYKCDSGDITHLAATDIALYSHYTKAYFDDVNVSQVTQMDFKARINDAVKADKTQATGYYTWGSSILKDGSNYRYYGNRWDEEPSGFNGWLFDNRILYKSSTNMLGPFNSPTVLTELLNQSWCEKVVSNPWIVKDGSTYYLFYMGTRYTTRDTTTAQYNQRIGVATSSNPGGPFTPSASNPVLSPRSSGNWDSTYVTNPSVYRGLDGKWIMMYKAKDESTGLLKLGTVKANSLAGPWNIQRSSSPITLPGGAEDPGVWYEASHERYYALCKAMDSSTVPINNGILLESLNGEDWKTAYYPHGSNLTVNWSDGTSTSCEKVERHYILTDENGDSIAVFQAVKPSGINSPPSFNLGRSLSAVP